MHLVDEDVCDPGEVGVLLQAPDQDAARAEEQCCHAGQGKAAVVPRRALQASNTSHLDRIGWLPTSRSHAFYATS